MTTTEAHTPSHRADVLDGKIPYRIESMPDALQREKLTFLTGAYEKMATLALYQKEDGSGADQDKIDADINAEIEQYLDVSGFEKDAQTDKDRQEYELAYRAVDRAIRTSKRDWIGHPDGEGGHKGVSQEVFEELLDHYQPVTSGRHRADVPQSRVDETKYTTELSDTERDQAYDALDAYGEQFVADMVKRSKRSFEFLPGQKKKIEVNREKLSDILSGLAAEHYFKLDASLSDEQKAAEVDRFIAMASEDVISRIEEERRAEYEKARPTMKRFYDLWASWGKEKGLITKGKLYKAGAMAIPLAAVGALAAPVITAGAATAGVGALGFMGARSIGRRLASVKMDRASNITTVAEGQANSLRAGIVQKKDGEIARPVDEIEGSDEQKARVELNVDHNVILEMVDKQSTEIRKRNRTRTLAGTAIALTIGLASSRAASAVEGLVNYVSDHGLFGDEGLSGGHLEKGDHDIKHHFKHDHDHDGVKNGQDYAPNNPDITHAPTSHDVTRSDMFDGQQGSRHFTREGQRDFNQWISRKGGYEVKPGDSVWKLSEQYLNSQGVDHPTTYEVDAVKDSVLKEFRAKGLVDSNGWLTAGDTIKIKQ